ncbi:hypothetical protein [Microbacterium saperdae]|uniref:Uncharacterized protein n=1 Tax=Microbacterium saperdae TaxID=69368 RepID=A0A543BQX7_9MICO|nr:hypothetical protein [Microbacterium saperdae]TQL87210.1 hypothetical protein FB560_2877 [Microbacterium saperdae]GGM42085.1 hypothetical protein GCM10010489_11400 [Microbacterium saperdae]
MVAVRDADVALFLCRDLRRHLTEHPEPDFKVADGWIAKAEWDPERNPRPKPPLWQVVFRDDGTDDVELHVGSSSIGASVLAGSKDNPDPAERLARLVKTTLKQTPRVESGNPIAAVESCLGPYAVTEASTYARQYIAVVFSVVGDPV